jgi:hypothetical protein
MSRFVTHRNHSLKVAVAIRQITFKIRQITVFCLFPGSASGGDRVLLLRFTAGVLFAVGGWQTAAGLRPGAGATAWAGLGLIAGGLALEVVRGWWRRVQAGGGGDPDAEPGAAADGGA